MRTRDIGYSVGTLTPGRLNRISDVPGVRVGHCTVVSPRHNTGVTVVMPCVDNPFIRKLPCASFVLNGFGKTAGLVQVDELGTLETPIALTNTLNVGLAHDAIVEYMIGLCRRDGVNLTSVNPVVCECNDAALNDIQDRAVKKEHVFSAIENARADFDEGAVGCGRGTTCHGFKSGVGSASRLVELNGRTCTVGVLVQTNHGQLGDFRLSGDNLAMRQKMFDICRRILNEIGENHPDKGSCIVILATDLPLSDRQLRRVIKRCSVGLARLGSFIGHGSGEVFVGFSTANRVPTDAPDIYQAEAFSEERIDLVFRAAAECTEEAVLNSMIAAEPVTGYTGETRRALSEFF